MTPEREAEIRRELVNPDSPEGLTYWKLMLEEALEALDEARGRNAKLERVAGAALRASVIVYDHELHFLARVAIRALQNALADLENTP